MEKESESLCARSPAPAGNNTQKQLNLLARLSNKCFYKFMATIISRIIDSFKNVLENRRLATCIFASSCANFAISQVLFSRAMIPLIYKVRFLCKFFSIKILVGK